MSARLIVGLWIVPLLCAAPVAGQDTATAHAAFHLLSTDKLDSLQQALDEASVNGYVVAFGSPAYQLLVLRQRTEAEEQPVYRVLDGQATIEQTLAEGYRAVPETFDVIRGTLVVVAQRVSDTEGHRSRLLHTKRTGNLNEEIQQASAEGFHVVGLASDDSGHGALLERSATTTQGGNGADPHILLAANRQDTLQHELAAPAQSGYRIVGASAWKEVLLVLERREGQGLTEYRVLSTTRSSTLEREINAAAMQGFHYVPGTLHAVQKGSTLLGRVGSEFVAIMERSPDGDPAREYSLVGARRLSTLSREFDEAVTKGLAPVALTVGYQEQDNLVLFERPRR